MRVRCLALALAVTLAFSASAANAAVVLTFNDLTEAPSVSISGGSANIIQLGTEDFLVVLPTGTLLNPPPAFINEVYALTEGPGGALSDLVYFTSIPGSTALEVEFVSDTEGVPLVIAPGSNLYGSTAETGLVQTIPFGPGVTPLLPAGSLTVQVQSDIESVPEPSILALAGTGGLLGLGLWGYRRRKA